MVGKTIEFSAQQKVKFLQEITRRPLPEAKLNLPAIYVKDSFITALSEYHKERRNLDLNPQIFRNDKNFLNYLSALHVPALIPETPKAVTTLWYTQENTFIGKVIVRHRLDTIEAQHCGHIGYEVRPTQRRQGHASKMLQDALPFAKQLGLQEVIICCEADNTPSQKVIVKNGGILQKSGSVLRYKIVL